jgi:two-component system, cell cycle sensor histidine kinase and response regulator CckA
VVGDMMKMLRRLVGENIDLVWQPGSDTWPVKVDPAQIDQILANLSVNARDAIDGAGYLILRTNNVTLDEHYCGKHTDCKPGDYVQLVISDTGCGMDKEVLDHLFEPFFTTKALGEGTGLGLSTVFGIIKQNQGHITVYSEPGMGTSFNIFLPRYYQGIINTKKEDKKEQVLGGNETILLVEDEAAILHLNQELLTSMGYKVISAISPEEALKNAGKYKDTIHLLLTDVIMPGMNGRQLAEQLIIKRPDMKIIFMSGYTSDIIARHGVLEKDVHFIQKPFNKPDMAKMIRQALTDDIQKDKS